MNFISKLFKKQSIEPRIDNDLYKGIKFDSLKEAQNESVLEMLRSRQVESVYIKDALDKDMQTKLVDFFNTMRTEKDLKLGSLDMYPTSFITKMHQEEEPKDFFLKNQEHIKDVAARLGFDLEEMICGLLTSLNEGHEVRTKTIKNGQGSFSPFQFRTLNRHKKTYNVHCENGQHEWAPIHNNALGSDKLQLHCIAFFFALQEASGGELALFDKQWESGEYTEPIDKYYNTIVTKDGKRFDCSPKGIKRKLIDVKERDLVLFNGGDIWHMIENVTNEKERITLGAFIEIGLDGKTYVWV